jgi:chemotaxis protein MotB
MPEKNSLPAEPLLRIPRRHQEFHTRHGGAWKVAYADFATAMLSLFIVLWMMNAGGRVKESVQGYFRDPQGYKRRVGTGLTNLGENLTLDHRTVRNLQNQIEAALRKMPEFPKIQRNVLFTVTGEGLRIDLVETEQGMFFGTGSPSPTTAGEHLLKVLADELAKMPNQIVIEGHTDSQPFRTATPASGYSNWELAADRANTARRLLFIDGLRADQIVEMRGFANQRLLNPADPNDPRNRRVSVVVKYDGDRSEDGPPASPTPSR